jgi:murein DD-endopeptidase MepM/ murein hydrolase activator NlpD
MADWRTQLLGSIGAKPTQQNLLALDAWKQAEGTAARFNPLATTQPAAGAANFNPVGVKNYPTPDIGVHATSQTLLNGRYSRIVQLFRSGQATATQIGEAVAASPWGTGSLMLKVLGASPSSSGAAPSANPPQPLAAAPESGLPPLQHDPAQPGNFNPVVQLALQGLQAPTASPLSAPAASFKPGVPVASLTSVGAVHQTAGLDGYPARDYFAPSGSPAVAPVSGTIVKLSGHDPRLGPIDGPHGPLGWSVYIRGDDGHTYFLTHLGSRGVTVGSTVRAGQVIGTVADYAKFGTPSHIHQGVAN